MRGKQLALNGEAHSRMFSNLPNSGFAIGRDPAAFDHMMRQVVEVFIQTGFASTQALRKEGTNGKDWVYPFA
jgi:hypothetical protein